MLSFLGSNKKLYGTAAMIGTMVGAGIFAIPFSFAKAGFPIGLLYLVAVAALTVLINWMYAEIVLRTQQHHQLVGYVGLYLGAAFRKIVLFADILSIYGALLAYIILAGTFLANIFSGWFVSEIAFSIYFYIIASSLVMLGLKRVARVEIVFIAIFSLTILVIFFVGLGHIDLANLRTITVEEWFMPYGILLFAFAGISAIPIQREILRGQEEDMRRSIFYAVAFVAVLYLIFAMTTVGISGDVTTPDALSGLHDFLGDTIVMLGSIFGIFAVSTSFLLLGSALRDMYFFDQKIHRKAAGLLVVIPPIILFAMGLHSYINILSIAGSVAIGIITVMIILTYWKSKHHGTRIPEYSMRIPKALGYLVIALCLAGIVYALIY